MLLPLLALALSAAAQDAAAVKGVAATVEATVPLPPAQAFRHLVPIPLERIFRAGYGLPAITGTSVVAPWNAVGQSRHVYFETGDSARETITHYREGEYFAYRVEEFTLAAKYVAQYAVGEWWWRQEQGRTVVVWRYTFVPKNFLVRPFLAFFVRHRWRPYMQAAVARVQQDAAAHAQPMR
ncbi:SRPBCC family protein [Hymenobacter terrenus]|uniref:SRPBCC family protein n=1 Tax=Hymenobacter terrenus TaxID=1629124 RepID=UPI0018CCF673|nr:SRPBCC family protein [Hymenobacter terrenus]